MSSSNNLADPFQSSSTSAIPMASTSTSIPTTASSQSKRSTTTGQKGSMRPSGGAPTSHMESTITRLLVATKQLLEGLAKWSRGELSEDAISEIYVKLGNDFNVACAAFARENIGMSELLSVPSDLRICLETCLSEVPSQATLERHLPKVRQIIIGLLHGLREKQRLYRDGVAARRVRETQEREAARVQQQQASPTGSSVSPTPATAAGQRSSFISDSSGSSGPPSNSSKTATTNEAPLSPDSASKSRDNLRRFVNHTQQSNSTSSLPPTRSTSPSPTSSVGPPPVPPATAGPRPTLDKRRSMSTEDLGSSTNDSTRNSAIPMPPRRVSGRDSAQSARSVSGSEMETEFGAAQAALPTTNNSASLRGSFTASRKNPEARSTRAYSPPPPPREADEPQPMPVTPTYGTSSQNLEASPRSIVPVDGAALESQENGHPSGSLAAPPAVATPNMAQLQSLEALRQSDNLSRRASKRYSAYAIQKITTGSGSSPIRSPTERRVVSSSNNMAGSDTSATATNGSSAGRELANGDERARGGGKRPMAAPSRKAKSEFRPSRAAALGPVTAPSPLAERDNTFATIMEENSGGSQDGGSAPTSPSVPPKGSTNASPPSPLQAPPLPFKPTHRSTSSSSLSASSMTGIVPTNNIRNSTQNSSDSDTHEYPLNIFLQIGRDVKKARLTSEPSLASLKLLFVERFQYNPGANDFPSIYLRDGDFGVHYELEDVKEVKNGSVLSLNIDTVEQVKQHIDQGLSTLSQDIKELRSQMTAMRRSSVTASHPMFSPNADASSRISLHAEPPSVEPSEQQYQDAAQKVLRMRRLGSVTSLAKSANGDEDSGDAKTPKLGSAPVANATKSAQPVSVQMSPSPSTTSIFSATGALDSNQIVKTLKTQHEQVQNLRREIGVLRQVYTDFGQHTKNVFAAMRVETSRVHKLASSSKVGKSRSFVEAGVTKLDQDVSDLVLKVDEVQDTIEQMRTDVVRGVRPRVGHLSETSLFLKKIVEMRDQVSARLASTKSTWAQTWSEELAKVLGEQETVQKHESMLVDLADDLNDVKDVLKNIEAVTKSTKKLNRTKSGHRLGADTEDGDAFDTDPGQSLSNVLLEVKGLQPDANKRLEAIAKAERQRELELANRTDEFAEELGDFVTGGKLKKSGGVEETERLRQARSEATLKAMFSS